MINSWLMRFGMTLLLMVMWIASSSVLAADSPSESVNDQADQILNASGVKGGLVVLIGCDDGRLAARLNIKKGFLVQALDTDLASLDVARKYIQSLGRYGKVSVGPWNGKRLPYADNLVNLVIADDLGKMSMDEVMRVLVPGGVALIDGEKTVKPRPADIDEWTHYLHSPSNNAVAQDTVVGPPRHYQWIGGPRFSRSHDHLASVSAMVSANGRTFSIVDEGSIAFAAASPHWKLVARDAFNGIRLWEYTIKDWEYHLRDFRSGPADIARRLVAVGDTVYVTLGYGQPVIALDAATGETLRAYDGTDGTCEILCDKDSLFVVVGQPNESWGAKEAQETVRQENYTPPFDRGTPPSHNFRIACISASTGETKWINQEPYTRGLMPATLTVSEGKVFFHNLDELVGLDAKTGKQLWKAERPIQRRRLAWSSPTVVAHDGIVYTADRAAENTKDNLLWLPSGGYHQYIQGNVVGKLIAYDAASGKQLWDCHAYEGFNSAVDIFIADGLLWTGRYAWGSDPGITEGRDPKTGEIRRTRPSDTTVLGRIGHARCHRAKATSEYLILGRRGTEFVDLETGDLTANLWVRGVCAYGVMPANGLITIPPHSCACNVNGMIKSGFIALAPEQQTTQHSDSENQEIGRLVRGPAYLSHLPSRDEGRGYNPIPTNVVKDQSWPTYRRDASRSGSVETSVSPKLKETWNTTIGGSLTPPVAADNIVLVAAKEQHTVHALDAGSGKKVWSFTADARIDSPPTLFSLSGSATNQLSNSYCIFGCRDGYVYCLRTLDGKLAWKYRAAPYDRLITVDGQLESAWPVSGSLLVIDGIAYFAAGRDSFLAGGIFLHKVDAAAGTTLEMKQLEVPEEKRNTGTAKGFLPDVLAAGDEAIYMRGESFSPSDLEFRKNVEGPHLWSSVGFLDHNWWHRTYWQYGTSMGSGWGGWHKQAQLAPVGRLLVTDGSRIYGYGRSNYDNSGGHVGIDGRFSWGPVRNPFTFYRLFGRGLKKESKQEPWSERISVMGQGLLLTGNTLFVAGPDNPAEEVPHEPVETDALAAAIESPEGGKLLAISPSDGSILATYELEAPPVFDGLIAADRRLYMSTADGRVICLTEDNK